MKYALAQSNSELMEKIAASENQSWPALRASIAANIPARRVAIPSDIASVAVFLASVGAEYVNGTSIRVDGAALS